MADESGPPRSKYPPPKPPTPTTGYQPSPPPPQPTPSPPQPQPGYRPDVVRQPSQPPARWPLSIISAFCFLLVGIVGIVVGVLVFFAAVTSETGTGY